MGWFRTILREILGLFVDDGSFAAAIAVWLAAAWLLFPRLNFFLRWKGLIMFAGLGLILVESVIRYARKTASRRKSISAAESGRPRHN